MSDDIKRDGKGRFAPGTKPAPGPGRPPREEPRALAADYLRVLTEEVTSDDWRLIVGRVKKDALKGRYYAIKFLADYLLPRPVQAIDLSVNDQRQVNEMIAALREAGMNPTEVIGKMIARANQKGADGERGPVH